MSSEELRPLLEFTTDRQREVLEALIEHGSQRKAAKALGIMHSAVGKALRAAKRKAALQGYAPDIGWNHPVPEPHFMRGVTVNRDEDGKVKQTWEKSWVKASEFEAVVREFVDALKEDVRGKSARFTVPKGTEAELLTVYPMGDPHIGMYAWAEETGDDFDVDIASRDLNAALTRLVAASPPAETALILNLGDFFHADNTSNTTSRSGHQLDVDTRWPRVLRLGAQLMIQLVALALQKHKRVIVKNLIGNHDDHSSIALGLILDAYYSEDPRVNVDLSPAIMWYMQHGECMIAATHGHTIKLPDIAGVMAADKPDVWGSTKFRYAYTGHVHHERVLERFGVLAQSFRTLAARDAYTAGAGYRSGRDMQAIVLHKRYGEIMRHRVDICRVKEDQGV
jgi:hypothetical protein